jgi:S-formylglutathione hydrolase FrmB
MSPGRPTRRRIRRRRRAAALAIVAAVFAVYASLRATLLAPTDRHGAAVARLTIHSDTLGEDQPVNVALPGAQSPDAKRPLLVFLHGKGGTVDSYTDDEAFFEALARLGRRAPIVAFPEDDGDSYWHDRATGNWGTYIVDEVIPEVVRRFDADPIRVAIGGISMGGFGAYDLALRHPGRFCAVGGHSPALWLRAEDTAPGAFDDAEDFERHDVLGALDAGPAAFGPIPIWNDYGSEDPFGISDVALTETLEAAGANLTAHRWPGAHDRSYWDRHWPAYLRFYAAALADC